MDVTGFALVLGAGSGIGLETALTLAQKGASGVAFADLNLNLAVEASEKSQELATSKKYQTVALQVDVVDRGSVRSLVADVQQKFGRIDYAINSAGVISGQSTDLYNIDGDDFDRVHKVNCKGALHFLQEIVPVMKSQEPSYVEGRSGVRSIGRGAIVNVTSLASFVARPGVYSYTSSKFGARGVIKCAALEYQDHDLRINEVCPAFTDTPLIKNACEKNPAFSESIKKMMPMGRMANVEEVAEVAHFLVSPAASFIHGQSIIIDNGLSLRGVLS